MTGREALDRLREKLSPQQEEGPDQTRLIALDRLGRRLRSLEILLADYAVVNQAFNENLEAKMKLFTEDSAPRRMTSGGQTLLDESRDITELLHLRIEAFYLFANMALDLIAKTFESYFETYFGQARAASLNKHSDLLRNLASFTQQFGLPNPPSRLIELANEAEVTISEFRDRLVAHEQSPRALYATSRDRAGGDTSLFPIRHPPRETDPSLDPGVSPPKMDALIDAYVLEVVQYLDSNEARRPAAPQAE